MFGDQLADRLVGLPTALLLDLLQVGVDVVGALADPRLVARLGRQAGFYVAFEHCVFSQQTETGGAFE
jgi:hypothetical protein